jgi:hypothetical protein
MNQLVLGCKDLMRMREFEDWKLAKNWWVVKAMGGLSTKLSNLKEFLVKGLPCSQYPQDYRFLGYGARGGWEMIGLFLLDLPQKYLLLGFCGLAIRGRQMNP